MALEFLGAKYGGGCFVADGRERRLVYSANRKVRGREDDAQNWIAEIELISDDPELRSLVFAHQLTQGIQPFLLPMPQALKSIGFDAPTGSLAVAVQKAAGGNSVTCTSTSQVTVRRTQFVGFAGHRKVYMASRPVAMSNAQRVLPIYPNLVDDVAAAESVALEPNLYAVYDTTALRWGELPMDGRTKHYVRFRVLEYLE